MPEQKPSIGRVVHYVSYGTPGGEYTSECCAAIVTSVQDDKTGLFVLYPNGTSHKASVAYHDGGETPGDPDCPQKASHGTPHRYCACGWMEAHLQGGTWHWPERV